MRTSLLEPISIGRGTGVGSKRLDALVSHRTWMARSPGYAARDGGRITYAAALVHMHAAFQDGFPGVRQDEFIRQDAVFGMVYCGVGLCAHVTTGPERL